MSNNGITTWSPDGFVVLPVSFTRPADTTAYAANDLVGVTTSTSQTNLIEIPNAVRAEGEAVRIERVRLHKSGPSLTNAQFRVHLWRAKPTLSVGDNGAFSATNVYAVDDVIHHAGYFDVTMDKSGTAGARAAGVPNIGSGITLKPVTGTSLYFSIEALAAYTPVSGEVFTATFEGART